MGHCAGSGAFPGAFCNCALAPIPATGHDPAMALASGFQSKKRCSPSGEAPHLELGRAGEEEARSFLAGRGFAPRAVNWRPEGRAKGLELDLVGEWDGTLVFVEVKTRKAASSGHEEISFESGQKDALSSFTPGKRRRMVRAARYFLAASGLWDRPCRFDLVCVTFFPDGTRRVEHHIHVIEFDASVGGGDTAWQPW